MAVNALGVGIGIIVACVIFKIICWILIYKNSEEEKKKLKVGQLRVPWLYLDHFRGIFF